MRTQLAQLETGTHVHQRSLDSLVEDGSYHDRLRRDVAEFIDNPWVQPRDIPDGLVQNAHLMLAMDQFKDIRGYTNYASRLQVGPLHVLQAFVHLIVNEKKLEPGLCLFFGAILFLEEFVQQILHHAAPPAENPIIRLKLFQNPPVVSAM